MAAWLLPNPEKGDFFNYERARKLMSAVKVDALLITQPHSFIAATNFPAVSSFSFIDRPSMALIFADPSRPATAIIPTWDAEDFSARSWMKDIRIYSEHTKVIGGGAKRGWRAELVDALQSRGDVKTIGIEERFLAKWVVDALVEGLPSKQLVPATDLIRRIRAVKTKPEISLLRRATKIMELACEDMLAAATIGISEEEIGQIYHASAARNGGEETKNFVIGFGRRGAISHAIPGDYRLQRGKSLRFDLGTHVHGYHSDTARSYVVGAEPTARQKTIYDAVLAGEQAAARLLKPGARARDIYSRAVDVAREMLPEFHMEHVGHGLGVEQHESPPFILETEDVLEPDMVVNVETLFFDKELGAYAVEDTFLITTNGAECWTTLSRDLQLN